MTLVLVELWCKQDVPRAGSAIRYVQWCNRMCCCTLPGDCRSFNIFKLGCGSQCCVMCSEHRMNEYCAQCPGSGVCSAHPSRVADTRFSRLKDEFAHQGARTFGTPVALKRRILKGL